MWAQKNSNFTQGSYSILEKTYGQCITLTIIFLNKSYFIVLKFKIQKNSAK